MPHLFGRDFDERGLRTRIGCMSQVAGARSSVLDDGSARGVRVIDVRNGSGLRFTVCPDRGLDIADATWRDVPLAWLSPSGLAHPNSCEPTGLGWLRGFPGGLLTTCGLSNVGTPAEDQGVSYGLHGRASYAQAERVSVREDWIDGVFRIAITGILRETSVFGPNLEVARTISTRMDSAEIRLTDEVRNRGFDKAVVMLLYHVNVGWPIVDENTELLAPACRDEPRDEDAAEMTHLARSFEAPREGYREKVYYRDVPAGADGFARVALVNPSLGSPHGIEVAYRTAELPILVQWKMMGLGTYVCGLEPSNVRVGGRAAERAAGRLTTLSPGSSREFAVRLGVVTDDASLARVRAASAPTKRGR